MQHFIKQLAMGLNFEVEVEKELPDGCGSADVLVKKGGKSFAFEISISTPVEHEIENIQKRLKAGVCEVTVVCTEEEKLARVRQGVRATLAEQSESVSFCVPDGLGDRLLQIAAKCKSTDSVVHGRRTKVEYKAMSAEEAKERRTALAKVAAESLKKMKPKS